MELLALNNDNPNPRELKESFKDLKIIRCSDSRYDHMFLFLPHWMDFKRSLQDIIIFY